MLIFVDLKFEIFLRKETETRVFEMCSSRFTPPSR